jgi:uncharacterized protein YecE (DUF72 family)
MVDEPMGVGASTPPVIAQTSPLAVIRLHGHNDSKWDSRLATAAERFQYAYPVEELQPWVEAALFLSREAEMVHVLMNNCFGGEAVRNAALFGELLRGRGPEAQVLH